MKKNEWRHRTKERLLSRSSVQALPFVIAALITGSAAVAYSKAIQWMSTWPAALFHSHPGFLLIASPICFLMGWWLVYRFAPEAAGSGIPQVMAAHELDHDRDAGAITRLLGLKTMVIKVASSLVCILGGGAIGREGPTIQIAASIFHAIGTRSKVVWPNLSHRSWIIAGGAAGIAAAFNTPLGGIVYAIEELSSSGFAQFRSLLITAVIISGLMAQWISGPYLYLGQPALQSVTVAIVPVSIVIGAICGLTGGVFGSLLHLLVLSRSRLRTPYQLGASAAASGLCFATLVLLVGLSSMGSGVELITSLLFQGDGDSHWSWILGRFFGSTLSYISGCAGGIFAPSLAVGGTIGAELGQFLSPENRNLAVLLGMIGFLTGVTRAPFTAFVLVLEMTDRHTAIFPMMVAAVTALGAARTIGHHSFYELMRDRYLTVEQKGKPNER